MYAFSSVVIELRSFSTHALNSDMEEIVSCVVDAFVSARNNIQGIQTSIFYLNV